MSVTPDVSFASLHPFISENVSKDAEIKTDGWSGYNGVKKLGYTHVVSTISASKQ